MWNDYRCISKILAVMTVAAMALHIIWMQHVHYDPLAPFWIFLGATQGGYFPFAALMVWILAKASIYHGDIFATHIEFRTILVELPVILVLVFVVTKFMYWEGVLNAVSLTVLVILIRQTAFANLMSSYRRSVEWLIIILAFACSSYVFTVGKAFLFYVREPLDLEIIGAELMIFGKPALYSRIADFGSRLNVTTLWVLEVVYFQLFSHMLLVSIYLDARGDVIARRRYVIAIILSYLGGVVVYYVVPGFGPAFFDPERFLYFDQAAPGTRIIQGVLEENTKAAREGFRALKTLDVYAFIACMPSLHVAHEMVMVIFSRGSLVALLFSIMFMVTTWVSILVLGWHYVLDVPFGLLLGIGAVGLSHLMVSGFGRQPVLP